jgi:hypothetical protein
MRPVRLKRRYLGSIFFPTTVETSWSGNQDLLGSTTATFLKRVEPMFPKGLLGHHMKKLLRIHDAHQGGSIWLQDLKQTNK